MSNLKNHWEDVYKTKTPNQVSWTQSKPTHSLQLIADFNLAKDAKIIDVGGGDSNLVDFLLAEGYTDITVLDISGEALKRAQKRLGDKAASVTWIESSITEFKPLEQYAIWHDRAVFHFLTETEALDYIALVKTWVKEGIVMATFSKEGPQQCSGLNILQYNVEDLHTLLDDRFTLEHSFYEDHNTPFDTTQNFVYCRFLKKTNNNKYGI